MTSATRSRKRFGQHFLHDPGIIDRIITAFNPRTGERIVEIGPGRGALTGKLLAAAGRLDVIELDRDLAAELPSRFSDQDGLTIHSVDALAFDFTALAAVPHELRIIGNLPYNISTPLIFHCLDHAGAIQDMLFMLQREVVERMVAEPGSKTYGRLSVMTRIACEVENLFLVRPGAFQPPPKVDSAIVRLIPHRTPLFPDMNPAALATVVRHAFSQRRKTLRNSLRDILPVTAIESAGIDPGKRAEQLSLAQFAALADALSSTYNAGKPVDNFVDK